MPRVGTFIFLAAVLLQPLMARRLVRLTSMKLPLLRRSPQVTMFTEEVSRSVEIERAAEACFDAYSQLERIPEWCSMLGQIKVVSPTRSEWRPRLPAALARVLPGIQWTSDQCLKPEECTIEWQSISGIDNSGCAEFQAVGPDKCILTLTVRYTVPDWLQPVVTSRPARVFVRSTVNTTVEQFKAIIEAEGEAEALGVAGGEAETASARLAMLRAEQRCAAAAALLMTAVDCNDITVLEATLEEAVAAGVDRDLIAKASAKLEALRSDDEKKRQREAKEVGAAAIPGGLGRSLEEAALASASDGRVYTSGVSAEIEINCSASAACAAYSDIEKFATYVPRLKSVRIVDNGRSEWELQLPKIVVRLVRIVGMGSLIKWQASYTVEAPRRLTWQSLSGFENAGVATFEPLGDARCRTVVNMTYSVPLVLKPLESSRWVKRLMSSTMRDAMEAFQLKLEADGQSGEQR